VTPDLHLVTEHIYLAVPGRPAHVRVLAIAAGTRIPLAQAQALGLIAVPDPEPATVAVEKPARKRTAKRAVKAA
jgi:hypothetical protein